MTLWCRMAAVADDGTPFGRWVLEGPGTPDLGAVDAVARRALWAARVGGRLVLSDVAPELSELLVLAALPVQVERQPEGGEQAIGIEEVKEDGHLGDLPP